MARSIATIQQQIISNLVSTSAAEGVTVVPSEWSRFDFRQLMTWVAAVAIAVFEQLQDVFKEDIAAIAKVLPPQTPPWLQNQVLNNFEYDATAVPIVQLDTNTSFTPQYPDPNPAFNIIKYCSVVPGPLGTTKTKVAIAGPAIVPATPLSALQSFIDQLWVPGMTNNAVTFDSDKLYVAAQVYYRGLYAAIISTNVIAAITSFLASIPFDGVVVLSDLEAAIKSVPGVTDVVFNNVQARADTTAYGSGTNLVVSNTVVQRSWDTFAGYIIPETDTGHTLADSLIFIPG